MAGIPIIHLGPDRPLSPRPLPSLVLPLSPATLPSTPSPTATPATSKRYKSILKKMTIPITWGEPPHAMAAHNKLHKNPPKNVHFTPPPSANWDAAGPLTTAPAPFDLTASALPSDLAPVNPPGPIDGLPAPESTPTVSESKKKKGGLGKLLGPKAPGQHAAAPGPGLAPTPMPVPSPDALAPSLHLSVPEASTSAGPSSALGHSDEGGTESWHHHASYFPEYEPIHPSPTVIPGLPDVHNHTAYFPDYEPIFHHSHPINAYPGASGALAYALTTPEAEAAKHAARVGHSVSIHYPDLPRFAEYQSVSVPPGWQGNKWGVEGWTGYGWQGEKLPSGEGLTFGAPMPKGVPVPTEAEIKKQKEKEKNAQKAKDGDEGDDGGDQPEGEEGKEGGEGGDGAEGGGEGGGGGGGGKKKKKKKK